MGGVKDLLDLSGNAMKYMIIEDRLLHALRMKWQDANMSHFGYYIANINPPIVAPQYKGKKAQTYPITSHYPHETWLLKSFNTSTR